MAHLCQLTNKLRQTNHLFLVIVYMRLRCVDEMHSFLVLAGRARNDPGCSAFVLVGNIFSNNNSEENDCNGHARMFRLTG